MLIIVTNDDGIWAPGIQALARKMTQLGKVLLVAPREEQSATGHGITILDPIRVKKIDFKGIEEAWAVSGTPADCVKLAVQELAKEECSLVVSGINNGPNLGTDVLYSGTVSAAIEGAILGIPSMAVSLGEFDYHDYETAAEISLAVARHLYANREVLPPDTLLNVNVPALTRDRIRGLKATRLGVREYENVFDRRLDPRGNIYYWLKGEIIPLRDHDLDVDVVAVGEGYVSISPIHFDLTKHRIINSIKKSGFENITY